MKTPDVMARTKAGEIETMKTPDAMGRMKTGVEEIMKIPVAMEIWEIQVIQEEDSAV
jgi:hypothetical protein